MLKPDQVPKEAIEAAAVMLSNGKTTAQAIAAAINAWPGVIHNGHWLLFPHTKLPLPTESTND